MEIVNFKASKLHGHVNLSTTFKHDLTFLTGINGSGKTSIVNGISALMSPSIPALALLVYESISVTLKHEGKRITIAAAKNGDSLRVACSLVDEPLHIGLIASGLSYAISYERELEYYREMAARTSADPVVKSIRSLPTPMVLGIERRVWNALNESEKEPGRLRRPRRTIFGSGMMLSVDEAAELAESAHRKVQAKTREIADEFKKQLILNGITFESSSIAGHTTDVDLKRGSLEHIRSILVGMDIPDSEVTAKLEVYFNNYEAVRPIIDSPDSINKAMQNTDSREYSILMEYLINRPQYVKVQQIALFAERYTTKTAQANARISDYLATVNEFLRDSHKEIAFGVDDRLVVRLDRDTESAVANLSSGEIQLVVILTHAAFSPEAEKANVFIIDEPELSLHLRWQQLFVDAVRRLNPNLQLILATHSPAIILDRDDHCVDVGGHRV